MSESETHQTNLANTELEISDSTISIEGNSIHQKDENTEIVKSESNTFMEEKLPANSDSKNIIVEKSIEHDLNNQDVNENNDIIKPDNIREHISTQEKEINENYDFNQNINGAAIGNFAKTRNDILENNTDIFNHKLDNNNIKNVSSNGDVDISLSNKGDVETKNSDNTKNHNIKINHTEDPAVISESTADIKNENKILEKVMDIPISAKPESDSDKFEEKIEVKDKEIDLSPENIGINELTDGDNFVDILGNGLLTKRVLKHGLGRETRPTHGDSVSIKFEGWNASGESIDSGEVSFVLGDGDMIQAFDLGICLAERQEEFELKTDSRFAYGNYGWEPLVQPNETLTYHINLLRVDDAPDYTVLSHDDRMKAADFKRERGNYLYRREEYSLAVNSYSRAIKIIETDPDYKRASTDPTKVDMYDLFVKVTNNLAAAQLKLESYDNVIETCNTILNYDASNVKALFRKGKSLTMKGNYDEAIPILKRALELENSKLIASEIQRCFQLKRAEDEQRARVCRKMFGTGAKDVPQQSQSQATPKSTWRKTVMKLSPYIGAVLILIGSYYLIRRLPN